MEEITKFFLFPGATLILWLIVIDYILGFVGAILKKEFKLGKVAKVMGGPVLNYLLGLAVLNAVGSAFPAFSWLVSFGVIVVVLALIGSILENLTKFGVKIPNWLKRD